MNFKVINHVTCTINQHDICLIWSTFSVFRVHHGSADWKFYNLFSLWKLDTSFVIHKISTCSSWITILCSQYVCRAKHKSFYLFMKSFVFSCGCVLSFLFLLFLRACGLGIFFGFVQAFQILNSDDHANFLKKQNRNPADYRPDIIHQVGGVSNYVLCF